MDENIKVTEKRSKLASFFDTVEEGTLRTGNFFNRNLFVLLAFAVPFVLMSIAFAIMECEPFGDKQILVTDLWHQYYPFLVDYQDKLKNGESLFWSWTQGGGTNYLALASYYLASPIKFLTVLLPYDLFGMGQHEWLRMFLTFSVALKIALAGCFFAIFLRYTYKRDDISLTIFGTCFALSAFFMGYYWCEIWLDTAALTPLVIMGMIALMREGKYKLYVITLAISILANYYIGLFTCIFVFLCFVGYQICCCKSVKRFLVNFGQIAGFTAISLMLTLFLMLPAFFGLQTTHAVASIFPSGYNINIGETNDLMGTLDAIRQVVANSFAFVEPSTKEGLPNVACGVVSIVLAILFMTSSKVKLREKIFNGCLLSFLIMSFIIRQLDYMWHGFHFTNMIPYRFSYLVSFVLVAMAFRALSVIEFSSYFDLIIVALATTVIIVMGIGVHEKNTPIITTAIISAVIIGLMFLWRCGGIIKPMLCLLLAVITLAQGAVTAYMGVKTTTVTSTSDYPRGEENTATVIKYMKNREAQTPELYRADFTSTQTLCDPSLNTINGISMFNSMTNESFTIFAQNFGLMGWRSGNRYTYAESSPVTNLFMNLKYIIARDGRYNNSQYLTEAYNSGPVKLLENDSYIPMGFMTNSDLLQYQGTDPEDTYNPFDKQNEFFSYATGIDEDVYTHLEVVTQGHTDYETFPVNKQEYGRYSFSTNDSTTAPHLKWNYEAPKDGYYYAYVQITDEDRVTIKCNDQDRTGTSSFYIKRPYIMSIGYFNKGDKISVYADLEQDAGGSAKVFVNVLNKNVYEKGVKKLQESVMKTTKYTGSSMEGTIDVKEDGLFYTSIPFEDGKVRDKVEVNGKLVQEDDYKYYYVDGKKSFGGLIPIGEDLYYVNSSGWAVSDGEYYITKTNSLIEEGSYTFDKEGKMINPPEVKNGESIIGKLFARESEGWTAYVDGEEVEITPIADALVAFELGKGKHTIKLKYVPKGFTMGAIISVTGLVIFVGIILLGVYLKKRKVKVGAKNKSENDSDESEGKLEVKSMK